jgi:uncharacterized membrane protein (DUF4010 family)
VIVAIVAREGFGQMVLPMCAMFLWMSLIASGAYTLYHHQHAKVTEPSNPAQLKSALFFGLFYAVILFATGMAKQRFGQTGLLGVSIVSGLVDLDAITLSLSRMITQKSIQPVNGLAAHPDRFVVEPGLQEHPRRISGRPTVGSSARILFRHRHDWRLSYPLALA